MSNKTQTQVQNPKTEAKVEAQNQIQKVRPEERSKLTQTVRFDLNGAQNEAIDLSQLVPKNVNLVMEYWNTDGAAEGETKRVIFMRVEEQDRIPDYNDSQNLVEKPCAYFVEQGPNGLQIMRCAASRLVSSARLMQEGEAYEITYLGKKKNRSNNNLSARFAIQPLELQKAA